MNEIAPLNAALTLTPTLGSRGLPAPAASAPAGSAGDSLELSETAQIIGRLPGLTPPRAEKIAQIRQAIQDGAYETPERLEGTLDRLMDVLNLH